MDKKKDLFDVQNLCDLIDVLKTIFYSVEIGLWNNIKDSTRKKLALKKYDLYEHETDYGEFKIVYKHEDNLEMYMECEFVDEDNLMVEIKSNWDYTLLHAKRDQEQEESMDKMGML